LRKCSGNRRAGVLYVIASGKAGFDVSAGFASNGYAAHSPGGYSLARACRRGSADFLFPNDHHGSHGSACSSSLCACCYWTGINLDSFDRNSGYESFRQSGAEHRAGGLRWKLALAQLWLFWVAPIIGGTLGGVLYAAVFEPRATTAQLPSPREG
jgi:aquaporin Z